MSDVKVGWLLLAVLILAGRPVVAQETGETAARASLDEYLEAWNAEDNEAIARSSHFPRLSIGPAGQVVVRQGPDEIETDFELLRRAEGWDHTTLDLIEAVHVAPDKVHYRVVVSRRRSDGSAYRTGPALYIVTRQNGRWGLQLQSILPPTFTAQ